ncbi:hypothetical protein PGT21_030507 [Puccinia graminis f. sp. tritici]|uniref:Uncharacterized protein n=1 Tax=Puccinia graminis f. sp. tritici TaxID=56615 RepID=A0A5B0ME76_PUCGR|nr:hypothetical protein PGT21_030507 [Puccinia graminis f. sp. tritici]
MSHSKVLSSLDLDDMLPELPFSNVKGGSQKSYLGAPRPADESFEGSRSIVEQSQSGPKGPRVVRVFHENPTTESQLAASGGVSRPMSLNPGGTSENSTLRPIAIDYLLFHHTTSSQIAQVNPSNSKSAAVTPNKEWGKITPYFDTVWKAALEVWSWPKAQACITTLLGEGRPNLDKHIRALEEAGLLKWQCILANHGTYGSSKFYYVYSDKDFSPFVAALVLKPKSKVTIKITMADPRRSAKDKESERSENDSLAMAYALDDERLALQKVATRLAVNPKCDTDSAARTRHIVEITEKILDVYGGDAESMRIKDPADPQRSLRITRNALFDWSRALVHEAKGVTTKIPPQHNQLCLQGHSGLHACGTARKVRQQGNQLDREARDGSPCERPAEIHPCTGNSGRPSEGPTIGGISGRTRDLMTRDSSSVPATPRQGPNLGTNAAAPGARVGRPEDFITPDAAGGGDGSHMDTPDWVPSDSFRDSSTDLEVISAPLGRSNSHRSPARKIPRSPAGEGIAHTISRLNFDTRRDPRANESTSPTRKLAGSSTSSSFISGTPGGTSESQLSAPLSCPRSSAGGPMIPLNRDRPPLNEAGRALGMDEFLVLCNFRPDDMVPRVLVGLTHIRHWDFFYRDTDVIQLQQMGFPYPIATQIINGAEALGHTHTTPGPQASEADPSDPQARSYQPSPEY